jgi:hypothetical protein
MVMVIAVPMMVMPPFVAAVAPMITMVLFMFPAIAMIIALSMVMGGAIIATALGTMIGTAGVRISPPTLPATMALVAVDGTAATAS